MHADSLSELQLQLLFITVLQVGDFTCYICIDHPLESENCSDLDIQLAEGTSSNTGKIKVCVSQHWSTICGLYFDSEDSAVVCSYLGFQRYGNSLFYMLMHYESYKGLHYTIFYLSTFIYLFFYQVVLLLLLCMHVYNTMTYRCTYLHYPVSIW